MPCQEDVWEMHKTSADITTLKANDDMVPTIFQIIQNRETNMVTKTIRWKYAIGKFQRARVHFANGKYKTPIGAVKLKIVLCKVIIWHT